MLIDIWKGRQNGWPAALRIASIALAFAYPVLAHGASLLRNSALTIASVMVLAAAILFRPLTEGRRWAWFGLPLAVLAIMGLSRIDAAALVLFVPPVLLNVFLAWLFGHTLARGSTPLIERVVRLLQPPGLPFEAGVMDYARRLTQLWTGLFLMLGVTSLVLAALATPGGLLETAGIRAPVPVRLETWSLFANVLNYGIVAALFLAEFSYRRRRFPGRPYRGLLDFLRRTAAIVPALVATFGRPAPRAGGAAFEAVFTVPLEHPAFAGHFPGRPVFPAVALLDTVIEAAGRMQGAPIAVAGLPRAKFLAPLGPGDSGIIRLQRRTDRIEFEVSRGGQRVAEGVLRLRPPESPGDG